MSTNPCGGPSEVSRERTGSTFYVAPSTFGCYLYQSTAKELGAIQGDHIVLLQGRPEPYLDMWKQLSETNEPGQTNLQSQVWMDITTLRTAFGHEDESNVWFIHNAADGSDQYGYNDQVRDDINTTLAELRSRVGPGDSL